MTEPSAHEGDQGRGEAVGSERLLLTHAQQVAGNRILCTSLGRAQLAQAWSEQRPHAQVTCCFLDIHRADRARQGLAAGPSNLQILCLADFPDQSYDLVALPVSSSGEAELVRDQLQQAHERLETGGLLLSASDNAADRWLHEQLSGMFDGVTRLPAESGVVYIARKTKPLKRKRDFACTFSFPDRGRIISVHSRPGVFAHRRLDDGARQLIKAMNILPGQRVIDIGCGSGAVALAASAQCADARIYAVDSNSRAVQCTQQGALLNGFSNIGVELNARGDYLESSFDVAFANPPYFSSYRIAGIFLDAARRALVRGGRILLVTKATGWYEQAMPERFERVSFQRSGDYTVIHAEKA